MAEEIEVSYREFHLKCDISDIHLCQMNVIVRSFSKAVAGLINFLLKNDRKQFYVLRIALERGRYIALVDKEYKDNIEIEVELFSLLKVMLKTSVEFKYLF